MIKYVNEHQKNIVITGGTDGIDQVNKKIITNKNNFVSYWKKSGQSNKILNTLNA